MSDSLRRAPLPVRAARYATVRFLKAVRHSVLGLKRTRKEAQYRIRETGTGVLLGTAAAFVRAPRETIVRRRMAARNRARFTCSAMDASGGYGLLAAEQLPRFDEVLATCRRLYELKTGHAAEQFSDDAAGRKPAGALAEKRTFLRNLLDNDDLRQHQALVDFALSDAALGLATNYLGTVPRLNRVDLLYSLPRATTDLVTSQLFHLDPEGLTQVKLFINVFDTGDAEGPFTFVPADDTARILRDIRARRRSQGKPYVGRYSDEEIAAVGGTDAIVTVKGPQGSGVAVDTSRCLHLGSRVQPGSFRLCLYVQYCTSIERGNVFDIERFRNDPVRYLAVRHSTASAGAAVSAPHQMA
jgi:hypothetical protein